jgi:ABC-type lipoprotein release transport system permease subunit
MRTSTLLARNLAWYWRTNATVVAGVATAVATLAGALLVGDSVRASLRDLVLARLGDVHYVVARGGLFGEDLAAKLGGRPMIVAEGVLTHAANGRRAGGVEVYGVAGASHVLLSAALARELGSRAGDTILLRVPKPSAIPLESLHGRKEDAGKTIRLSMGGIESREFSLRPQQGDVRAVYVPLARLQRELGHPGRVNTIVAPDVPGIERLLKERYTLADLGLKLRRLEKQGCFSLESDSALISDELAATVLSLGLRTQPISTYLANTIRAGGHEIPYSVVTALETAPAPAGEDGITLNEWAARDLGAKPGDPLSLDYYVWRSDGRLRTESAQFRVEKVVPIEGAADDRDFAPDYPGITTSASLRRWDPPFPLDLARVRPVDERYWDQYRATPKAFIRLARGRQLWGTRFGSLTSIRIVGQALGLPEALRASIDPTKMGLTIVPVRAQGLAAARGATDFGEYFVYFSFFLMVSALLLTGLFFRLGVEQRTREIGVLRALGFSRSRIRTVFLAEGAALAVAGAPIGMIAAPAWCAAILAGLRTWWFGAVGTTLISLHVSASPLLVGATAGAATGLLSIAWTLRRLDPVTPRGLLAGERRSGPARRLVIAAAIAALVGIGCMFLPDRTAGFFGAGTLFLLAALLAESGWLRSRALAPVTGQVTLGFRSAAYRPGRSILSIALIASATFLIVSLDTFRREGSNEWTSRFPLLAESVLPLIHDPNTPAGREALNIPALAGVEFFPFRLRPGDDASCLNLYRPRNPRILAPAGANPWPVLESSQPDGAVPAIADANSLEYVLHLKVGEEFVLDKVRYRIVAALRDSLFQSELIISEKHFLRLFPDVEGYRFFLLKGPPEVAGVLESALSDYGFDVQPTEARLASFHRVENTYLSTFRALGALGLVLGTIGLGVVLLRNVLERRRELALLRAVGYRPRHLAVMVLAENSLLLVVGLATGAACALAAVAPVVASRGGHIPALSIGVLLGAVLATGLAASLAATAAALRSPLLEALKWGDL